MVGESGQRTYTYQDWPGKESGSPVCSVLLRRPNGDLDSLSVLDGEFLARSEKRRRFHIPIRLRSTNKESNEYFFGPLGAQVSSPAGGPLPTKIIGSKLLLKSGGWHSKPEPLPEEFADEMSKAALWRPSK